MNMRKKTYNQFLFYNGMKKALSKITKGGD